MNQPSHLIVFFRCFFLLEDFSQQLVVKSTFLDLTDGLSARVKLQPKFPWFQ